jgi:hypothetical protein
MTSQIVGTLDFTDRDEPAPTTDWRRMLMEWLEYQRHQFQRKMRDLSPAGLVEWSVPPLELSVVGLVRHMTQMEHVYLSWGLGGGERILVYGDDDYAGGSVEAVDPDLRRYFAEVEKANRAVADLSSLESEGHGHGWPLGAALIKMIDEYALHSGQAHMLRYAVLGDGAR